MANNNSVKYISDLLARPELITDDDHGSIFHYRQTYPYFVPARYMEALEKHKAHPFSSEMLAAIKPYAGNWMLFCDFLEDGTKAPNRRPINNTKATTVAADNTQQEQAESRAKKQETKHKEYIEAANIEKHETVSPHPPVNDMPRAKESLPITKPQVLKEPRIPQEVLPILSAPDENKEKQVEVVQIHVEEVIVPEIINIHPVRGEKIIEEDLIAPIYTADYFLQQGEKIAEDIPPELPVVKNSPSLTDEEKSLMVMMSFSEWLLHFKSNTQKQQEDKKEQKALKTMWQKEKMAAAIEEENDEIPENVFEMAVNSITKEDGLASESLADIYLKQGKYDKAIEMFRKLSLRNPQKNAYFARKIEKVLKEKQS